MFRGQPAMDRSLLIITASRRHPPQTIINLIGRRHLAKDQRHRPLPLPISMSLVVSVFALQSVLFRHYHRSQAPPVRISLDRQPWPLQAGLISIVLHNRIREDHPLTIITQVRAIVKVILIIHLPPLLNIFPSPCIRASHLTHIMGG